MTAKRFSWLLNFIGELNIIKYSQFVCATKMLVHVQGLDLYTFALENLEHSLSVFNWGECEWAPHRRVSRMSSCKSLAVLVFRVCCRVIR